MRQRVRELCSNKQLQTTAIASDFTPARPTTSRSTAWLFAALFAILLASRLCHTGILWADEDYHQAAAMQALHGKVPYRDLWYDKPPLNIAAYLLFGAAGGAVLRIASAIYALSICWAAFYFAKRLWSRTEGHIAAGLAAFFLIFYFPAATITLEPDTLMILPHLWAVYFAWQRRPFVAGILAGVAMLLNVKAVFVLAACAAVGLGVLEGPAFEFEGAVFEWAALAPTLVWLAAGFLIPNALGLAWLGWEHALSGYVEQVWRWGFLYAGSPAASLRTGIANTGFLGAGLMRVVNWAAFHAALVLASVWFWWKQPEGRIKWIAWTLIAFVAAGVGWRFSARYLDQALPPLMLAASRGFALARLERRRVLQMVFALAFIPALVRFGPRYLILATDILRGTPHVWNDVVMDQDSRAADAILSRLARPGATLFVWGYRPNIFVYTKLPAASRFWDSQPLTGIAADRHLTEDRPTDTEWAAANRAELVRSRPDFIADGLSLYNPRLDIHRYLDLAPWLAQYCEAARTRGTVIYRRCEDR